MCVCSGVDLAVGLGSPPCKCQRSKPPKPDSASFANTDSHTHSDSHTHTQNRLIQEHTRAGGCTGARKLTSPNCFRTSDAEEGEPITEQHTNWYVRRGWRGKKKIEALKWADSFQSCLRSPFMLSLPLIAPRLSSRVGPPFFLRTTHCSLSDGSSPGRARQLRFHQNRTIKVRRKRYLHPAGCFLWEGERGYKGWKKKRRSLRVCLYSKYTKKVF